MKKGKGKVESWGQGVTGTVAEGWTRGRGERKDWAEKEWERKGRRREDSDTRQNYRREKKREMKGSGNEQGGI